MVSCPTTQVLDSLHLSGGALPEEILQKIALLFVVHNALIDQIVICCRLRVRPQLQSPLASWRRPKTKARSRTTNSGATLGPEGFPRKTV